jgi:hypothetical protein
VRERRGEKVIKLVEWKIKVLATAPLSTSPRPFVWHISKNDSDLVSMGEG